MKVELTDKVVVVTGAASGIGAAIAVAAAEADAGALLLTDRDAAGLEKTAAKLGSRPHETLVADLADPDAPMRIIQEAVNRFGRVDGLVNAAGLTTRGSMLQGTPEVWDSLFAVNTRAPYFLMQAALQDMIGRGASGAIVNILSINAHCGGPELAIYSASKGALLTLTKNAANAHLAQRIRVNGINLGWVATPSEHHMQAEVLGRGPGWLEEETAKMPLGRMVEAEEAARLAVYLLSDASAPMTGVAMDLEQRVRGAPA